MSPAAPFLGQTLRKVSTWESLIGEIHFLHKLQLWTADLFSAVICVELVLLSHLSLEILKGHCEHVLKGFKGMIKAASQW
ncbi:unnamed protein product [Nippostrongylus brasiliensis]|uniref:Transmembrane protein n=1 Tax=Nippostrongylus brasiliensis TaxID=27835 RepID=A0A0N4YNK7_NIPBR|nr:unnamed protein product [Nippostrongylus brasiliensis]